MRVSRVPCGEIERPKRPRSRAMMTPASSAIASKRTARPGQTCPPRLTTRTRQTVTASLDVEWSFSMVSVRSCQGRSADEARIERTRKTVEVTAIPPLDRRTAEKGEGGIREDGEKSTIDARGIIRVPMLKDFRKALAEEILLADGAMGTLLVSRGASPDQAKSPLNLTDPESVREVHDDYRDAGARILTTNTWDANRVKLTAHEWSDSLEKINREGVRIARESVVGELAFVAGSVGPLGALVKPYGSLTLVQVREIFEEQIRVLLEAGVDLLLFETFGSLLEAAEAVRAARGLSRGIPIVAEMTFLSDGRTAFGENASHALATLTLAGADAVGMNCTLGPQETHDVFTRLPASIAAPLSVMPNAGYPTLVHGRNVYLSSPDYLRDYARAYAEAGAAIIGGCCGTTPEHIRAMAKAVAGRERQAPTGRA